MMHLTNYKTISKVGKGCDPVMKVGSSRVPKIEQVSGVCASYSMLPSFSFVQPTPLH